MCIFWGYRKRLDGLENKNKWYRVFTFWLSKLKKSSPKKLLQRVPIAPAQVKAGDNSESLLNEIRQIVDSLYHNQNKLLKKHTIA